MSFVSPKGLTRVILLFICVILLQNVLNRKNDTNNNERNGFMRKFHQSDYIIQFERLEILRFNKTFLKKFEIVTFKYNRSIAAFNITWKWNADINTEGNVIFQTYRFASNEYRFFPARFQLNFCDAIKENLLGLSGFFRCGNFTGCPLKKLVTIFPAQVLRVKVDPLMLEIGKGTEVFICNWTPDQFRFPPFIPSGKYMIEMQGVFRNSEAFLTRGYGSVIRPFEDK